MQNSLDTMCPSVCIPSHASAATFMTFMFHNRFGNTFPPNNLLRNQRALRGQIIAKPGQPKWTFGGHPPVTLAPIGTGTGVGVPLYRNNAFTNTAFTPIGPAMVEVSSLV